MNNEKTTLEILIENSGIPIAVLAELCGVTRQTMYTYVKGTVLPRVDVAKRIAEALKTSISSIW